jgi:uncharacterized membrane protein
VNVEDFWETLESARSLDRLSDAVRRRLHPLIGRGAARDLLGGKWLGHPIHPALVTIAMGTWSSAVALDLAGHQGVAARRLIGLGTIAAPTAIATGWSDWTTLGTVQRRVGLVHAVANATAVVLFSLSYRRRKRTTDKFATCTALFGLLAAGGGGAIGGHLTYRLGANVTTNPSALEPGPEFDPLQLPDEMERASGLNP